MNLVFRMAIRTLCARNVLCFHSQVFYYLPQYLSLNYHSDVSAKIESSKCNHASIVPSLFIIFLLFYSMFFQYSCDFFIALYKYFIFIKYSGNRRIFCMCLLTCNVTFLFQNSSLQERASIYKKTIKL